MDHSSKIFIAGHKGLVGSAIKQQLEQDGYSNIITRTHDELDLRDKHAVEQFFEHEQPEYVFLAAARVGGIWANWSQPVEFLYDNLMIELNVITAAHKYGVKKLIFLGSSCIYPRNCPQPMKEEYLLTSELEVTNEPYAIAKIAGIKLCQAYNRQHGTRFISCMPTNLYGPGDNFDLTSSHVFPALVRKIHTAHENNEPTITLWGTGAPRREFLYVDDCARAIIFLMNHYDESDIVNIGTGTDCSILELAQAIAREIGYRGEFSFDTSKPDGTPQKLLNVDRIRALGWQHAVQLHEGITQTVAWYRTHNVTR